MSLTLRFTVSAHGAVLDLIYILGWVLAHVLRWGLAGLDPFDAVGVTGGVDVEAEDRDAVGAGVVEDEPFGVHAGVVSEDAGEERSRVVGLEPGALVGR